MLAIMSRHSCVADMSGLSSKPPSLHTFHQSEVPVGKARLWQRKRLREALTCLQQFLRTDLLCKNHDVYDCLLIHVLNQRVLAQVTKALV